MKKPIILIVCLLTVLIAIGLWWFRARFVPTAFTEDAVQVIGYEASRMFHSDPATSQDEIDQMIKSQHDASNINLGIDSNGKTIDLFGTAFRVQHQAGNRKSITTVVSAGPDREFGTADDVHFEHERETESEDEDSLD